MLIQRPETLIGDDLNVEDKWLYMRERPIPIAPIITYAGT